jgi:hypothetical protein
MIIDKVELRESCDADRRDTAGVCEKMTKYDALCDMGVDEISLWMTGRL